MPRKTPRPAPVRLDDIQVGISVVRGPHKSNPKLYYWRARQKHLADDVWTGWATRAEVGQLVRDEMDAGGEADDDPGNEINTVRDLLEVWLGEAIEPRTDLGSSRRRGLKAMSATAARIIGDVVIDRVDVGTLEALRNAMGLEAYATTTQRLVIETVRTAWRWGQDRGFCDPRRLPPPSINHKPTPRADPTWEDFWWAVSRLKGWKRVALIVIGLTGARKSEVAALLLADIVIRKGGESVIYFGRHELAEKTGERATIIPPELVEELEAFIASGEAGTERFLPVSFNTGLTGLNEAIRNLEWTDPPADIVARVEAARAELEAAGKRFRVPEVCAKLGVSADAYRRLRDNPDSPAPPHPPSEEPFTPRDVRNLVATTYYEEGKDPGVEAKQLGHSPTVALKFYNKVRAAHVARQVSTISAWRPPSAMVVNTTPAGDPANDPAF